MAQSCYGAIPKSAGGVNFGSADVKMRATPGGGYSGGGGGGGGGGAYVEEADYMGGGANDQFMGANKTGGGKAIATKDSTPQRTDVSCFMAPPK